MQLLKAINGRKTSRTFKTKNVEEAIVMKLIEDTAAATQNILLTAHSLGLGSCWVGAFDEESARKALNIPEGVRPVAMIPIGYPDETPRQRNRRPLTEIMYRDSF